MTQPVNIKGFMAAHDSLKRFRKAFKAKSNLEKVWGMAEKLDIRMIEHIMQ